jgi:hypothetical protein
MQILAMQFYCTITDSGKQEGCARSIDFNFERFAEPDTAMTGTDLIDHSDLVHIQVVRLGSVHILREHSNEVAAGFGTHDFFSHLAFAAFAAIWERFRGPRAAALARPPFRPPRRPKATAWGFLKGSAAGAVFGSWPVASIMIWNALWFGSRGRGSRVFDRSGMVLSV